MSDPTMALAGWLEADEYEPGSYMFFPVEHLASVTIAGRPIDIPDHWEPVYRVTTAEQSDSAREDRFDA